ncbi:hypothetical protein [Mesorhizobium sp. KR9-304]|uniref:hypothetical protein n=1 Tax=Mesorhizobium sp. KR9-304 TaxID=3156614 RepID=UPI0032B506B3
MFFDKLGSDDWRIRRRIIVLLLIWCVAMVTYIAIFGPPDQLREAIATALIILIGSIVGSYVFGVIWDDKSKTPSTKTKITSEVITGPETPVAEQEGRPE